MSLSIQNNIMALMAANNLAATYGLLSKSINSLSSGLRINGAADDAAGLAVRELMRSDIAVLKQGIRNANDAISMLQTMDGAAQVIDEKLIRMKELAEQASTGTYTDEQRAIMDDEFKAMRAEIDRIANATQFNGIKMLNGSEGEGIAQQVTVTGNEEKASGAAFVATFTGFASGDTLNINYTDHAGTQGTLSMEITSSVTNQGVLDFINAQSGQTGFTAEFDKGTFTFTDLTTGKSKLDVDFANKGNAGVNYAGEVAVEGRSGVGTYQTAAISADVPGTLAAGSFVAAFTNFSAGDTLNINYTTHDGTNGTSAMAIKNSTTVNSVVDWINTLSDTTGFKAAYADGVLTFTDTTDGVSKMDVSLSGGTDGGYSATITAGETGVGDQVKIHFGTGNDSSEDYYYANKQDMTAKGLGIDTATIKTQHSAQETLAGLNDAIAKKDAGRAHFGATINRLENTVSNLTIQAENIQAAESQISDIDVAFEMSNFINLQIKSQAAIAMLAQANMLPQLALSLMGA